jgi:tRNA(fMet)-specific endonuclease VapC
MTYLLDADTVIDYLSGRPPAVILVPQLQQREGIAVSSPVLIELYTGVYGGRNPADAERQLHGFLRVARVLPVNRRVILQAARLRADLLAQKAPIKHRAYDLLTAATALAYDMTLVTSNDRDYADVPGLKRLNPRTGQTW